MSTTTQPVSSLSKPELPHAARRRGVLLAILLVLALAWPISRRLLLRPAPAPLPANADDAARIRYDLAELQVHPADGAAYRDLGGAYERQGYYMAALKSFTLAQAMGVSEPRLAQDEGRCLLNLGRDEEARSLLAATARSQPDNADVVLDQAALEEVLFERRLVQYDVGIIGLRSGGGGQQGAGFLIPSQIQQAPAFILGQSRLGYAHRLRQGEAFQSGHIVALPLIGSSQIAIGGAIGRMHLQLRQVIADARRIIGVRGQRRGGRAQQ